MSINIKTASGLQKLTPEVTKSTISSALGYTPTDDTKLNEHAGNSDIHVTTSDKTRWNNKSEFSGSYSDLIDKPNIVEDNSDNFTLTDDAGNKIFQVDSTGTHNLDVFIGSMDNEKSVSEHIEDTDIHITSTERAAWNAKAEPDEVTALVEGLETSISEAITSESDSWIIADKDGNKAFEVASNGVTNTAKLSVGGKDLNIIIDEAIDADLGNVDNTSDVNKPVSTAQQTALDNLKSELSEAIESESNSYTIVDNNGNKAFEIGAEGITNVAKLTVNGTDIEEALNDKSAKGHTHTITANANDDDVVVLTGTAGTNAVTYSASHANSGVAAGTYKSVTVDAKGHVTNGSNPTTLGEYGITDATDKTTFNAHVNESDGRTAKLHINSQERSAWNAKMDQSDLNNLKTELGEQIESEADSLLVVDSSGNKAFEVSSNGTTNTAKLTIGGIDAATTNYVDNKITTLIYLDAEVSGQYVSEVEEIDGVISVKRASLPSLSKGTDSTATSALSYGGTFTAITDTIVDGHQITDTTTTYTLPRETTLTKGTTSGSGNAVTDISVTDHTITLTKGTTFLTEHPTITTNTDTTSAVSPTYDGTFTAVDSITKDANGHVTKVNVKSVTLSNAFEAFRSEISESIVSESNEFIVVDEDGNKAFEVDAEGTTHVKAITVDGVDVLGDISTALDSILTQTAHIIGGNS